jgi:glyceraldehyde-3-phosphate dehydrogenase (NADP+)
MGAPRPFLIAGQWRCAGAAAPVIDPYHGAVLAEVCQAGASDVADAIEAAVAAASAMRPMPAHARAAALSAVAARIAERREEFASTISAEAGKPISDARREVGRALHTFTVAAEEAKRIPGEVVPLDWTPGSDQAIGLARRVPIGPVLGITPFNFPLNLVAHKVAPCLAAGNPIVLKPAPQTPLTALLLGEVIASVEFPPGAFSVVPCENRLAESMVRDDRFKLVSFTGSAAVGWRLKEVCGKKRITLELGGNAGVLIEPDADLNMAAGRCAVGGFAYSGQTCISVQRVLVHEDVYQRFTDKFLACVQGLAVGDPRNDRTVVGPLINEAAARRVESWVQEAVGQGARILIGGGRRGSVVEPTVLTDVTPAMKVSCQEVFGPVVTLSRYKRFDEALAALNDSDFGLQAGLFTQDVSKIFEAYRTLEVGAVLANEVPTWRADHMPYGGVKDSGLGREGVRYAIEDMTDLKLLVLNLKQP